MNKKDYTFLIGKKFDKLTVIDVCKILNNGIHTHGVVCLCECGKSHQVKVYSLIHGTTTSCGCNYRLELTGIRFGRLTVFERVYRDKQSNLFRCVCDCGMERIALASELKRGAIVSCGCYSRWEARKVKYLHPQLYDVWKGMKSRCYNKNNSSFGSYGAKGVIVCDEWRHDFKSFFRWAIENGFESGLQLDKDIKAKSQGLVPNLYSPKRCQFVTAKINSHHKSTNKITMELANEIRSSSMRRVDLARKYNLNPSTVDKIKQFKTWN